ncbi:MAG: prolyl oligopeptidase family serine peptidase [Anaerolineae bacterium]
MRQIHSIRLMFVLRGAVVAILAVLIALPIAAGGVFIATLTAPACGGAGDPNAYTLAYQAVTIPAPSINGELHAYFIPAAGGETAAKGTIIAVPTGAAGQADRLHELRLFQAAGYNIFAYPSRTCAAGLVNSLGYLEVEQVGDALAYLETRGDLDMTRIGIHGFSAGGSTAIMAAARYPQIAAVVAQGGYHDFWDEVNTNTSALWDGRVPVIGDLFRLGAKLGYRVITGVDVESLTPIESIRQIAPRPVLLIYGTDEPGITGARAMVAASPEPSSIDLWEIPGAHHGDYVWVAGEQTYADRVNAFWDRALGNRANDSTAEGD